MLPTGLRGVVSVTARHRGRLTSGVAIAADTVVQFITLQLSLCRLAVKNTHVHAHANRECE